ncbi:hypothetical protein CMQ_3579 [Grosmannia clavigera kw1407]|uniref:Rhodanese domain-containing protein n=1 Tax=Grosmannia clavigera (strain kw1407 / UAMH 11150) TaxID=655863 RepID=F0XAR0_GROCL|nr:uncharacterized protein CMQ_3579 [Grosmannia clavigera kw1407]EFX05510.1 hypothetical protein CMQ_3579 [Grosmannia clavigera kw1407]
MATIASLKRISPQKLAELLLAASASPKLAVVDVRDDGDKSPLALSCAFQPTKLRTDVRLCTCYADYIGGHIRGAHHFPSSSLDATWPTLLRRLQDADTVVFHCALSQQRGPGAALRYLREQGQTGGVPGQTIYVLDRGFTGWQEVYGDDERLTEGFRKELWRELSWS